MAKTTAPLLSFGAAGQIGKTIVFDKWKGIKYARAYAVPANPQTVEQSLTRDTFSWLNRVYKTAPALVTDAWQAYASGIPMTDRNAFQKFNLSALRDQADLTDKMVMSPGAKGGLPPTQVVTPGDDQLSVAVTAPSVVPADWTVYSAISAVIRDQDPQTGVLYTITALEDLTSAYVNLFTGLASAQTYQVFSWLKWNRPDGTFAYSPSVQTTGLTT